MQWNTKKDAIKTKGKRTDLVVGLKNRSQGFDKLSPPELSILAKVLGHMMVTCCKQKVQKVWNEVVDRAGVCDGKEE